MPIVTEQHRTPRTQLRAGTLRALHIAAASPAIAGSGLLITALSAVLGPYWPIGPALWLAVALATLTRRGEQLAVGVLGFSPLTREQAAQIEPIWRDVCARAGIETADVDLYRRGSQATNAAAAGARSIALTNGALRLADPNMAPRPGNEPLTAILLHELGHHSGRIDRHSIVLATLAAPWRAVTRLALRIAARLGGIGLPTVLLGTGIVTVAIVQTAHKGHPPLAIFLGFLLLAGLGCPLLDAWVSRRTEYHADAYAAEHSSPRAVAAMLQQLPAPPAHRRVLDHTLTRHPSHAKRIAALKYLEPNHD